MYNRLEKLVAIAVKPVPQPVGSDNVLLKVCPRCEAPHSKYDTHCKRCAKRAKRIERILKLRDIRERKEAGETVSKEELELLNDNNMLSWVEITPKEQALLAEAPFELPEDMIVVRPTYKNRLQFFIDRMQAQGRRMTTTFAATKLLKFDSKTDFVDFAADNGVRSMMTADWDQFYAAWRIEDILKLLRERQATNVARTVVEQQPGKVMTSMEAAGIVKLPSAKTFVDFATEFGAKPAQTFGDKPEQMAWHVADVEVLRRINELDLEASHMEESIQRLERDIKMLQAKKPMKWSDMQAFREKTENLNVIRNELTKLERLLEQEGQKLQGLMGKREQAQVPTKKASDHRLVRIFTFATKINIWG